MKLISLILGSELGKIMIGSFIGVGVILVWCIIRVFDEEPLPADKPESAYSDYEWP